MTSLYIHIPFCFKKCPYCSFAVAIGQERSFDRYLECLAREAYRYAGTAVNTVYVGGGTPSLLSERQFDDLFTMARSVFDCRSVEEWTVEANPESLTEDKAACLSSRGVTRLSVGAQSFNGRLLKFLGRPHDAATAEDAVRVAKATGFQHVNLDLIFAVPNQTREEVTGDLQQAVELDVDHISLYSLNVEERTRFFIDGISVPSADEGARLYEQARLFLEDNGYPQYEVSNFARPGCASRHNQHYWRGGNYIGLGVGAHSHHNGRRSWNIDRLHGYMKRVEEGLTPEAGFEQLTSQERLRETFLVGLRMNEGVHLEELERKLACAFPDAMRRKLDEFMREDWLVNDAGRIKATDKGRLVLDELSSQLI